MEPMGYPIPVDIGDILRGHRQKETRFQMCKTKELIYIVTHQPCCPGRGRVDPTASQPVEILLSTATEVWVSSLYNTLLYQCMAPLSCLLHSLLWHFSPQLSNTGALQKSIYPGSSSHFRCFSYIRLNYAGILRLRSPGSSFLALAVPHLVLSHGSAHKPQPLLSMGLNQCASS